LLSVRVPMCVCVTEYRIGARSRACSASNDPTPNITVANNIFFCDNGANGDKLGIVVTCRLVMRVCTDNSAIAAGQFSSNAVLGPDSLPGSLSLAGSATSAFLLNSGSAGVCVCGVCVCVRVITNTQAITRVLGLNKASRTASRVVLTRRPSSRRQSTSISTAT
jgi:hypothetical protein